MKSGGKRSALRLTAWFNAFVSSQVTIQHDLNAADYLDPLPNLQFPDGAFYQFLFHILLSFVKEIIAKAAQAMVTASLLFRYIFVTIIPRHGILSQIKAKEA